MKKTLLFISILLLGLAACQSATITPEPPESNLPAEEPADQAGGPQAGPGEVIITGAVNVQFAYADSILHRLSPVLNLYLIHPDGVSQIGIFMPEDIQPGAYPIGNLITLEEGITARFDYVSESGLDYFESLEGTLELTETGAAFSGFFNFTAADPRDQSRTVTVSGNFEGVSAPE